MHDGEIPQMQATVDTSGFIQREKKIKELSDYLLDLFPSITTLLFTINEKKNDSLYDLNPVVYAGKGYVIETLEDFKFKIGPKSFFSD